MTAGGQFFPNGLGETVDGGYRITGAWNFGSGTGIRSTWRPGSCPPWTARWWSTTSGIPPLLVAVIPRQEIVFTDGWHVQGLKGTGSYDYNVTDLFVPALPDLRAVHPHAPRGVGRRRSGWGSCPSPRPGTPRGPSVWPSRMIDDVTELALTKVRMGDDGVHRPQGVVPDVASPTTWPCGRRPASWWSTTFADAEQAVKNGQDLTPELRAEMRVAATYATEASREIVQWAHLAAGTTAIREGSRLERAFRDMYTGTQHVFIGEKTYTDAAQIHLGLIEDQFGM